jgi:Ubiquitin carboxyl-terminal hydrolase
MMNYLTYAMLCSEKCSCCVQALARVVEIAEDILRYRILPDTPNAKFILGIQRIVASIHQPGAEGHCISLKDALSIFPKTFRGNSEQCARDFLDYLLSRLNDGDIQLLSTMVGEFMCTRKCVCGFQHGQSSEQHTIVSLTIPRNDYGIPSKHSSVQQMIKDISSPESNEVSGYCNSCLQNFPIDTELVFDKESRVLVLCIGIFQKLADGKFRKVISNIEVQSEVSIRYRHGNDVRKRLACIIYHIGPDKEHGHFVASFEGPNGVWFQANDARVTRVNDHRLALDSAMPFLLFYRPMDPVTAERYQNIRMLASRFEYFPRINPFIMYSLF